MIAVPDRSALLARDLPWFALAFALVSLLVVLFFQGNPVRDTRQLMADYQGSGLYELEWAAYPSWLRLNERGREATRLQAFANQGQIDRIFRTMAFDADFEASLRTEGERYWSYQNQTRWISLRNDFNLRTAHTPAMTLGLRPADPSPPSLLTLHLVNSGIGQWLIAMMVLTSFVWALEGTLGSLRTAAVAVGTAILATIAGTALLRDHTLPLYGSSVMVSALLGMYLGFYRTGQVRYLYPDLKARRASSRQMAAWLVAPLWLLLPGMVIVVGYSGALWVMQLLALALGAVFVQLTTRVDLSHLEDAQEAPDAQTQAMNAALGNGWTSLGNLAFGDAEHRFLAALKIEDRNFNALCGLYQIHKRRPADPKWISTTTRLLSVALHQSHECIQQLAIWHEVQTLSATIDLPEAARWQMVINFSLIDATREAEVLLASDAIDPQDARYHQARQALAEAFTRRGNQEKASRYAA